jgi:hypothetical protein
MSWKRGLFRSWLSISLLWWCGWTAYTVAERNSIDQNTTISPRNPGDMYNKPIIVRYPWELSWTGTEQDQCIQDNSSPGSQFSYNFAEKCLLLKSLSDETVFWLIFFPPVALFGVGLLGLWSAKGFHHEKEIQ